MSDLKTEGHITVILAHPNKGSLNHAIAAAAVETLERNGHNVRFHDLYAEKFDPLYPSTEIPADAVLPPDVRRHCAEISDADAIIIVHPNWWGQPPAILKGWVDRVLRPGVAYEFLENDQGEGVPHGLLKAKTAIVFNTSNTSTDREVAVFLDPLETIWKNCIFGLCGVRDFHRRMFNSVIVSSEGQRKAWLDEVRQIVAEHIPAQ